MVAAVMASSKVTARAPPTCANSISVGRGLSQVAECLSVAPIINCKKIVAATAKQRYLAGTLPCSAIVARFRCQLGVVTTARLTVVQKNSCASVAWAAETASGSISFTVSPPSSPWAITASNANTASRRTQRRSSFFQRQIVSTIVSRPTVVATMRWPCSQNRFPTMRGKTCPFESGQSDVARPASWLVTRAPAMIKKKVAQATNKDRQLDTQLDILLCHNRCSSTATVLVTTLSLEPNLPHVRDWSKNARGDSSSGSYRSHSSVSRFQKIQ